MTVASQLAALDRFRKTMADLDQSERARASGWRRAARITFGTVLLAIAFLAAASLAASAERTRTARYLDVIATAYCPCARCTDGDGITATGTDAHRRGVAIDPSVITKGARLDIPDYGVWIRADDTGRAIRGNRIDVRFADHDQARAWGRKAIRVRVWE